MWTWSDSFLYFPSDFAVTACQNLFTINIILNNVLDIFIAGQANLYDQRQQKLIGVQKCYKSVNSKLDFRVKTWRSIGHVSSK